MINFNNILAIGAHPDDIEISCLGTLLKYNKNDGRINTLICSYGSKNDPTTSLERITESRKALGCINNLNFDYFDHLGVDSNMYEELSSKIRDRVLSIQPDLILVHDNNDTHQEHRLVFDIVMTATRRLNISILKYYSPSSSINFKPDIFVDISEFVKTKKDALDFHKSQKHHEYINDEYMDKFHQNNFANLNTLDQVEQFKIERIFC